MSSDSKAFAMETKAMPWWLILIEGISAIIIGILLFTSTVQTMAVLVVFLGFYWLIKGIFDLVSMFVDHSMWGWKLFIGIIGILAGIVILRNPIMSTFAIPVNLHLDTWFLCHLRRYRHVNPSLQRWWLGYRHHGCYRYSHRYFHSR